MRDSVGYFEKKLKVVQGVFGGGEPSLGVVMSPERAPCSTTGQSVGELGMKYVYCLRNK